MTSKFNVRQYLLHISYLGTQYHGISKTSTVSKTICNIIEENLLKILPLTKPYNIITSSRTDRNVHAYWNTVRFLTNSPNSFKTDELRFAMNYHLSGDREVIRIHQIKEIPIKTNIISGVKSRTYLYRIGINPNYNYYMNCLGAWEGFQRTCIGCPFDEDKLLAISEAFSGSHDFTGFTNIHGLLNCKSPNKNMKIAISSSEGTLQEMDKHPKLRHETPIRYIDIFFTAESFMNKMVRYLTGCMIDVASGKLSHSQAVDVLNRGAHFIHKKPFECAPPFGLYLYDVDYEDKALDFDIGQWKAETATVMDPNIAFPDKKSIEIINERARNTNIGF